MALPTPIPYGLHDIKLTPYTDFTATTLAASAIDLPYAQTLSFAEKEDFEELRGDDQLITAHGKGNQIDWSLEAGAISLEAVQAMYGGNLTTTGISPNQVKTFTKYATHSNQAYYIRPFFQLAGQAISDSGGDFHGLIYRARCTDDLKGEFGDGAFWTTGASGTGFPSNVPATLGATYSFVQNETQTASA